MMRFTLLALLVWWTAAADAQKVLVAPPSGIDAERQLGCQRDLSPVFSSGNNATILSAASTAETVWGPTIPGGTFVVPEVIVMGNRTGNVMRGAGGYVNGLGQNHFNTGQAASKQATRLLWTGAGGGTMVRMNNASAVLENLGLQGLPVDAGGPEPSSGDYTNRAEIGLHINTSNNGAITSSGKHLLSHLGIWQCDVCVLVGRNTADPGAQSYTGDADSHADTIYAEDLHLQYPFSGTKENIGTGVWIRNQQSISNYFGAIHSHGSCEQVFWLERGQAEVGTISHVADASATTTVVRVGYIDGNVGGLKIGHVHMDALATNSKLLKADAYPTQFYSPPVEISSVSIPPSVTAVPQIDVAAGNYMIRNGGYLKAGSIKMTGQTVSGSQRICHVHLENIVIYDCNIDDLVDPASSGPYLLTWQNCRRYDTDTTPNNHYGVPFLDSTPTTEIDSVSMPARLTFDGN